MLLAGCNAPNIPLPEAQQLKAQREKELAKDDPRGFTSESSNLSKFDRQHNLVWTLNWKTARLDFTETRDQVGGEMQQVHGQFFLSGRGTSTYEASTARTARGTEVLDIAGGVIVRGQDGSVLKCNALQYDGNLGVMKASGNIYCQTNGYVVRGIDEVWADGAFQQVATPDAFDFAAMGPKKSLGDVLKGKK